MLLTVLLCLVVVYVLKKVWWFQFTMNQTVHIDEDFFSELQSLGDGGQTHKQTGGVRTSPATFCAMDRGPETACR